MSIEDRDWYREDYKEKERRYGSDFSAHNPSERKNGQVASDNTSNAFVLVPGSCTRCGNTFQVRVLKNVTKNYGYTCPRCGQRMTVTGKHQKNAAKRANGKRILGKLASVFLNLFASSSCLLSLYAALVIEREQMPGSPWPTLVTAALCWGLTAVIRNTNKREGRNIICRPSISICTLSAIVASGFTFFFMVMLFIEGYKASSEQTTVPIYETVGIPYLSWDNFIVFFVIASIVLSVFYRVIVPNYRRIQAKKKIRSLVESKTSMTPQEFMRLRSNYNLSSELDCPGIYVLHNRDKNKNYVGQSIRVLTRINQHFTGHGGNGDVYADYKYHDRFEIRIVKFEGSGYSTLNEMERQAIDAYDAYTRGYNKTRGNRD